ncbi:hypothetical protein INP57_29120 [Saccharopolyspora sp. HNM0986]|uniref:hypothetical protein n=1 Tax=Saccharopolyspora galaxeae TaxID=2781241 RepID=UPI001909E543|nr:hypothetical protein [Saccharopolyspora sp. HNM0986]MBK0870872.1 hypothetical protein [Saccharopolyspora sp. HNM0986]
MTGFRIDPEALEGAIKELEAARDSASQLMDEAKYLQPGELTAKDSVTASARDAFANRAHGDAASMRSSAQAIRDKVNEKIEAYRQSLDEYRRAEDNATVDASRIDRQR